MYEVKEEARQEYARAKMAYLQNSSEKNWKKMIEAKNECIRLGVKGV